MRVTAQGSTAQLYKSVLLGHRTMRHRLRLSDSHDEVIVRKFARSPTRKLVHGNRKSFIGGYRWQRNAPAVGTPGTSGGGRGYSPVSSR